MVDVPQYAYKEPTGPLESWNLLAHRGPKRAPQKHVHDLCFPTYDRICSWREIFISPLRYRNSKNLHHQFFRQKTQISQWSSCIHPGISDQKATKMVWQGTIVLLSVYTQVLSYIVGVETQTSHFGRPNSLVQLPLPSSWHSIADSSMELILKVNSSANLEGRSDANIIQSPFTGRWRSISPK